MKLIDSNIIIYSAYPNYAYLRPLVMDKSNFASAISMVEVLGFIDISPEEKAYFTSVFNVLNVIMIDDQITERAIEIRQKQKIKLGDLLIASTALVHQLEVNTRNVSDFQKITGLTVVNPVL